MYVVQVDGLQHFATVAHEACRGVSQADAQDGAHVGRGVVRHQDAPDGPVDHVHPRDVAAAHGHVVALFGHGLQEARHVVGVVREVGVHLEDVVVAPLQRPFESGDVGGAQPQLALALHQMQAAFHVAFHQAFHDVGRAVGAAVVDDEHFEAGLAAVLHRGFQSRHGADDGFRVFFLVVGGYDDQIFHRLLASGPLLSGAKLRKKAQTAKNLSPQVAQLLFF